MPRAVPRLLLLCLLAAGAACGTPGGEGAPSTFADAGSWGVPVDGLPSWQERSVHALTNAARMAPLEYRATYAADHTPAFGGILAAFPAVPPLAWDGALGGVAREHSRDMADRGCFQHASCDGTPFGTRVRGAYTLSGFVGENIAGGPQDPRAVVNMWLCDAKGGACCADADDSCNGHRANLLDEGFRAGGVGFAQASASPLKNYWTQDLGGVAAGTPPALVDGTHLLFPAGQTTFLANHHAPGKPAAAVTLVLDGARLPLTLQLGTAERGTWSTARARGAACRSYHFEAVDASGLGWRYPAHGALRTTGEGGCGETFAP
jgi:hypothetical protein